MKSAWDHTMESINNGKHQLASGWSDVFEGTQGDPCVAKEHYFFSFYS